MDNEVLRAIIKKNNNNNKNKKTGNTVRDYAEELGVTPAIISRHLKLIGKVKKMDKWVPHKLNENHKRKRFEISSALLLRNQNDPFSQSNCNL